MLVERSPGTDAVTVLTYKNEDTLKVKYLGGLPYTVLYWRKNTFKQTIA